MSDVYFNIGTATYKLKVEIQIREVILSFSFFQYNYLNPWSYADECYLGRPYISSYVYHNAWHTWKNIGKNWP